MNYQSLLSRTCVTVLEIESITNCNFRIKKLKLISRKKKYEKIQIVSSIYIFLNT